MVPPMLLGVPNDGSAAWLVFIPFTTPPPPPSPPPLPPSLPPVKPGARGPMPCTEGFHSTLTLPLEGAGAAATCSAVGASPRIAETLCAGAEGGGSPPLLSSQPPPEPQNTKPVFRAIGQPPCWRPDPWTPTH